MTQRTVEVLFFEGCPNVDLAVARAREALAVAGLGAEAPVVRVGIEHDADAQRRRFLGSPSVRVDGLDVENAARTRSDFGLQCRIYEMDGAIEHAPPVAWIAAALVDSRAG